MAKSDVRRLLEYAVRRAKANPEWQDTLATTVAQLNAGFYDAPYVDLVVQKRRRRYGVVDAYAFAHMYSGLTMDQIALVVVHVGTPPARDGQPDALNAQLAHLPRPFTAECALDPAGVNARLRWDEPVDAILLGADEDESYVPLPPGSASLVIGYTPCEETLIPLAMHRRLARWPDSYTTIVLLAAVDDAWYDLAP